MAILKNIHSLVAYLFLVSTILFIMFSLIGFFKKSEFGKRNLLSGRIAFIASHIQLILGLILWWLNGYAHVLSNDIKAVMSQKALRLLAVEHPVMNILAIALITIGFISIKKTAVDQSKHIKGIIYFGIALILVLSRIPYNQWLNV